MKCVAALLAFALVVWPALGRAQTETSTSEAQRLFDEGVELLERGDFANACARFGESHRLAPAGGTALDLGYCNERLGRLASALAAYEDARSRAQASGRADRASVAEKKLIELRRRVSRVHVRLNSTVATLPEIHVAIDGKTIADPSEASPVDPGVHVVEVGAAGMQTLSRTTEVVREGSLLELVIDSLTASPAVPLGPLAPPRALGVESPPPAQSPPNPRRTAAIALGVAGGVLTSAGVVAGVLALNDHAESNRLCPVSTACAPGGAAAEDRARTKAWISTAGIGLGVAVIVVAVYVGLTKARSPNVAAWEPFTLHF